MASKDFLVAVHDGLKNSMAAQSEAIPADLNKQRFIQNCMTVLQESKTDFSRCDPRSVQRTLLKGAFLGLDFFRGECYAIPFGNQCTFLTDYKGEIKLCKKYAMNPIKDIYAKVVREGDEFEEVIVDGRQSINFRPKPFNDGEIIGAFAVCMYKDGSMLYDTMSKAQIEETRHSFSKASNSKAWKDSYGEMCKKTVLRRLCKLIDLDFGSMERADAFEEGGDNKVTDRKHIEKAADVYADEPVDVEATEVEEPNWFDDDEVTRQANEVFK